MKITIYTTQTCAYCRRAEQLLRGKGVVYEKIDVTADPDRRAWLVDHAGGRQTVPVIFFDNEAIGGYDELARLNASGDLDRRLAAASP